jgi:CDP-4-dehydro-6-deoxyglucose reductase, E3
MNKYRVLVRPSGRTFEAAANESILSAALGSGITLPYGCKSAACGACKGRVLEGRIHQDPHAEAALSAPEQRDGYALFCSAQPLTDLVIEARVASALDGVVPHKMPARIEHIVWAAPDVAILTLKLPATEHLVFRAGQYVDFILPSGARRSYSIASRPDADGPIELHIRHMPGGTFTDALFGMAMPAVKERTIVRLEGPLGTFFLREDASEPIVLLASGTGFAPIKSIAETIFAKGLNRDDAANARPARSVVLYWGARTRADLYLDELPRAWAREQPNFHYVPVLSEEPEDPGNPDPWTGRTGFVHHAVMQDLPDLSGHHVYACGVPIMVQSAHRDFIARCGLPEESFFSDAFVSQADLAKTVE